MTDDIDIDALEKRMAGALNAMKAEFASLRTGRASASILEPIIVEAYGSSMPLNQCGTVNVPEPRMITVTVWDKDLVGAVEKAIRQSGIGINPVVDGMTLRLPIPELNEERRIELGKTAGQYAENARIAVRNVRRDGMEQIKKADMSEDDQKLWEKEVQDLTDKTIKAIDTTVEAKKAEIMQV